MDQQSDWIGITERICQLLLPLEKTTAFMTTTEEQDIRFDCILHNAQFNILKTLHGFASVCSDQLSVIILKYLRL